MATNKTRTERRSRSPYNRLRRSVVDAFDQACDWLFDVNFNTIEKVLIVCQAFLAVAVIVFSIVAVPPPVWQPFVLRLPAMCWAILLWIGVFWQGRNSARPLVYCKRRNSAIYSFVVVLFLLGPLFLKAPGLAVLVFGMMLFQAMIAAKFFLRCHA